MTDPNGVVIVGASVAGIATADALRKNGYGGRIRVIDAEAGTPHDKPPLSKQALDAAHDDDRLDLRPVGHFAASGIELLLGQRAVSLTGTSLRLEDGTELAAEHVVLTPGARPRHLQGSTTLAGVHVIRSLPDAIALRAALEERPRVVVAGCGFVGAEVAASVRKRGLDVTVVELADLPFEAVIGTEAARAITTLHREHGVDLRTGRKVLELRGTDRVDGILLDDGSCLDASVVVLGLGVVPNVEWLADAGVELADGIVCDAHGRTAMPGVWAAGDAAAWPDRADGSSRRIEHWTTAQQQGAAVGHNIATPDDLRRAPAVPYFWSDQYGLRIQSLGWTVEADEVRCIHGDWDPHGFVALYRRGDRLAGALGVNAARQVMPWRVRIENDLPWAEALDASSPTIGMSA